MNLNSKTPKCSRTLIQIKVKHCWVICKQLFFMSDLWGKKPQPPKDSQWLIFEFSS